MIFEFIDDIGGRREVFSSDNGKMGQIVTLCVMIQKKSVLCCVAH